MNHHQPQLIVANMGAIISQFGGHMGEIAAFLTIMVNISFLIRMFFNK